MTAAYRPITTVVCVIDRAATVCCAAGTCTLHIAPFVALTLVVLLFVTTITVIHVPFVGYVYSGNGVFAVTWPLFLAVGCMCVGVCYVSASVGIGRRYGLKWRNDCRTHRVRLRTP